MERRTNLPISVTLDDKESSSQESIVNNKVTETTVNTTFIPAKNNKITALNATRSSTKETPRKLDVMKCTKKLDEWLFLHTGKVFICTCNNVCSPSLHLRSLSILGRQWLHQSLSATKLCKPCFNKPPLIGNLVTAVYFQVTLCTDHVSTKTMLTWQSFHHNIGQHYGHVGTTPLLKFVQHEHWHFTTQCVQVNSYQPYNMYLSSVQILTVISANKCVDQLCIAYNRQIRGRIVVEQFQIMQYEQYAFCCQEFHLYNNRSMLSTLKISAKDAQQKSSGAKKTMVETLHQADDNLFNNGINFEICSCSNSCITKPVNICRFATG